MLRILSILILAVIGVSILAHMQPNRCQYNGTMTPACELILHNTATRLNADPTLDVVMVGGDDETGEYLTSLGVAPERISEQPGNGTLILALHEKP